MRAIDKENTFPIEIKQIYITIKLWKQKRQS